MAMPSDVAVMFAELADDLTNLHGKMGLYDDLFVNQADIAVLNDTAVGAFIFLEESLRHDMTMAIGRLADSEKLGNNQNLSLATLVAKIGALDPALHGSLKTQLVAINELCKPIIHLRHKSIGHNDLNATLNPATNPLPRMKHSEIIEILDAFKAIMNSIDVHFTGKTTHYNPFMVGSGKDLVCMLNLGLTAAREKRARLARGEF
jgi:AbiU2